MQPGRHVLLHIPRGADAPHILLRVEAGAQRLGKSCGEVYFQDVRISGGWVEAKYNGTLDFLVGDVGEEEEATWMTFGTVDLKVARGRTPQGIRYFNLYAKHLGSTKFKVGGLLGEDDHTYEATPDKDCVPSLSLGVLAPGGASASSAPSASSAEARLA
jgi:hypothetical protein